MEFPKLQGGKMEEQKIYTSYDLTIWKRFIKYLKPYKKQFAYVLFSMMTLGIIDAVLPYMTKYAIDNFINKKTVEGFKTFGFIYIALVITVVIVIYSFIIEAGKIENNIIYDLRKKSFEKLQNLSLSYYDQNAVGQIMSRVVADISRLGSNVAWNLVDMFWGFSMMIAVTIVMFFVNVKLAWISLITIPLLVGISIYFQKRMLEANRKVRKVNSIITGAFNEGILGAKTSKVLVREAENISEFSELSQDMKMKSIKAIIFSSIYLPIVVSVGSIGTVMILVYGGKAVSNNIISYGVLILFLGYTKQFFEPIRQLARVFAELQAAQAALERVLHLIEEEPKIQDTDEVIEKYGDILFPKTDNWEEMHGDIEFQDVNFFYKEGEPILKDFNLKVKKGDNIALVGETGSGKSTIVNLLCRFYEPNNGKILIDGVDYKERSQSWLHSNLGYVLQSPHLFSGTIIDNIRYGNNSISDQEVIASAKLVNAHNFIMKLENGYYTEVGEGGAMLSTGEKQLISFARAIISKPKLFVLDEATSSIDTETEALIQDAIHKVLEGRTSFVIAHRLSTIRNADKILVIKKGVVVESGTHHELLSQKGYYYKLYMKQFVEEKESEIFGRHYEAVNN